MLLDHRKYYRVDGFSKSEYLSGGSGCAGAGMLLKCQNCMTLCFPMSVMNSDFSQICESKTVSLSPRIMTVSHCVLCGGGICKIFGRDPQNLEKQSKNTNAAKRGRSNS